MNALNESKSIVFLVESLYRKSQILRIFCQKVSWLAENSEYRIYMVLTEKTKKPNRYELSSNIEMVNLDVNYDKLEKENPIGRVFSYIKKKYQHRRNLKRVLREIRPVATVSMMEKEVSFLSRMKAAGQVIYEVHYDERYRVKSTKYKLLAFVYKLLTWMRIIGLICRVKKRDILVADTDTMAKIWKKKFKNTQWIPNPLREYPPIREQNESKKVIAVNDNATETGFEHLIDMWERIANKYPEWRLHLYGNGHIEHYKELVKSKHLSKSIQCYNYPDNLIEIYPKYALYVQANKIDRFGQYLAEAMAYSIPCVAYRVPYGPRELIRDEINGFLIRPNHLMDFSSKLGLLIRNNELRWKMGRQSYSDVHKYELNQVMYEWLRLFDSIPLRKKANPF